MANETVTFGPCGSLKPGNEWDDKTYSTIRGINIRVSLEGSEIESIQVEYDNAGKQVLGNTRGGASGGKLYPVKFNYPSEFLVSISGYCGKYLGSYLVVKSLTLHTNIKPYGPYGKEEGTHFITPINGGKIFGGKIVGFFGRAGARLDSIGVYIKPLPTTIPSVGPFGTTGEQQWDDGTYSTIREIIIKSGALIDSIQVVYDSQGKRVLGQKHGSDGGQENKVTLDYPSEFLVSVSGYYGQVDNMVVIRSLGFESNKRSFGPFGMEDGKKFKFPFTCGKIIGFHGSSDKYLTSIGAYLDK